MTSLDGELYRLMCEANQVGRTLLLQYGLAVLFAKINARLAARNGAETDYGAN